MGMGKEGIRAGVKGEERGGEQKGRGEERRGEERRGGTVR